MYDSALPDAQRRANDLSFVDRLRLSLLVWLQPIVRDRARAQGRKQLNAMPTGASQSLPRTVSPVPEPYQLEQLAYWSQQGVGRGALLLHLHAVLNEQAVPHNDDDGWQCYDVRLSQLSVITVTEYHSGDRQLTRVAIQLQSGRWTFGYGGELCVLRGALAEAVQRAGLVSCQ